MAITVSILTGGSNGHTESATSFNALATDFVSQGIVGAISNTSGVAPSTGGLAVNAQGTPNNTTQVSAGTAYVLGTPTAGTSQMLRVVDSTGATITHAANASGSTRYDFIYLQLDATKMANPAADASDVASYFVSRSTLSTSDTGTPPTYGYLIAVATITNAFTTVSNAQIADKRSQTGANAGALGAIGPAALSTGAIYLGSAQITSNVASTGAGPNFVTGLTVPVTIPTGGRRIKITVFMFNLTTSSAGQNVTASIWDGTVGSGTQLQAMNQITGGASLLMQAIVTPAAGAKTYNVGISGGAGVTLTAIASATTPAFILVEAI